MLLVLVGFSVVIGALLAYVNHLTQGEIEKKKAAQLQAGIVSVMGNSSIKVTKTDSVNEVIDGKTANFVIHNISDSQGQPLGAAVESATSGFGGPLKVLVGFDTTGKILGYTILESSETPGLGMKAGDWFQKGGKGCVIGLSPADGDLTVTKDGGKVDAITASTITSRAFLKAINQAYGAWNKDRGSVSQVKKNAAGANATMIKD
jgi:electron transport complex protein RnfG